VLDWNILPVQKIKAFAEQNINFSDTIDYLERGVRDDYYFRFGVGLTYYFQIKTAKNHYYYKF
jgi:curli production assembly/transport component CsgG